MLLAWLGVALAWWYFALAPLPNTSPQWVATARAVCFGSQPNGLPESYGWITLVLTPLLVSVGLVVVWTQELSRDLRLLGSSKAGRSALALTTLVVAGSLIWGVARVRQVKLATSAISAPNLSNETPELVRLNVPAPPFDLIDQQGRKTRNQDLQGETVLLSFAFSRCESICPGLLETLRRSIEGAPAPKPRLVIITLDPWRDTPQSLPRIAKKWKLRDGDLVLSGEPDLVQAVSQAYELVSARNMQNGDVTHQGVAYLIDETGRLIYRLDDPSVKGTVEALGRLQDEQ